MKLAYVVQRYGAEIWGGAEAHCRAYAERVAQRGFDVEVFTTCATDYRTWANALPAGESMEGAVKVRRFPVTRERTPEFDALCEKVLVDPRNAPPDLQVPWMEEQGPYVPDLVEMLSAESSRFDLVVFVTYLYYTTYFGLPAAADRSVLHPTAHDERPIHLSMFDAMFRLPRAFVFLTEEERLFVTRRFGLGPITELVAGMGIDPPPDASAERARERLGVTRPYLLYLGRIDPNKGIEHLYSFFAAYRDRRGSDVELILAGDPVAPVPAVTDVRAVGPLDEQSKWDALAGAELLIQPSFYESFAINLLEAWAVGTPAIVNGACDVTVGHCRRSQGGLWYGSYAEFEQCMDLLLGDEDVRLALGEQGRRYVDETCRWETIIDRYALFLHAVRERIDQPRP